jgi:hypothetical protein
MAACATADEAAGPSVFDIAVCDLAECERVLPVGVRDFWEECAAEAQARAGPLYFNLAESEEDTSDVELEMLTARLRQIQAGATGI